MLLGQVVCYCLFVVLFLYIWYICDLSEVSLVAKVSTGSATFFVHAIQLQNDCDYRSHEFDKRAVLSDGSHWLQQFKVLVGDLN